MRRTGAGERRALSFVLALAVLVASGASLPAALAATALDPSAPWVNSLVDYVHSQKTTGFIIVQNGKIVLERNWPAAADTGLFRSLAYETTPGGALLEDVASQQKSFVSFLAAVAVDKGLIDVNQPVSFYLGAGWSKATPQEEARIRVLDVLTMSSGLTEQFAYASPPGTVFHYNTPVYAVTKRVLEAAAHQPLDAITTDWLTEPAGMTETSWRRRPATMADVGNPTGLVTSPGDAAKFGELILDGGVTPQGRRLVSTTSLASLFIRSTTNPAYGRLWWLNGSSFTIKPGGKRLNGPLIPAAPADLVAALGALDRKIYVAPSQKLVVVRLGEAAPDPDFDQQLWLRLAPLVGAR